MARCARCCLHNSIRIVNLVMLLCGTGMIIYSLWLQKKWDECIAEFPLSPSDPLKPWFIYTLLGVGIIVCLSTIGGYIITNCISNSTLCFYIVAICCLLFLEVAVIVAIFFKIDWGKQISTYTGQKNTDFEILVLIHVKISRAIMLLILVAQISVVILAAILLAAGTEPRTHLQEADTSVFESILFNASRATRICRELWTSLQKMWDCFISTRRKCTQRLFFTYQESTKKEISENKYCLLIFSQPLPVQDNSCFCKCCT
ncbi:TETRASPANIN-19-LIKE [Salix viminalis]|uniref:TETRASPANIN-19-LIKE n=1 Tax=Salix viminalis TaxID=40686 RepID=A0A9Q0SE31_SALVM|nr:TETRASPANIN-19-LIKE [Salix viminalis]